MGKWIDAAAAVIVAIGLHGIAYAANGDTAKAEQNRKKPLQRCDELADKAQLECLQKAREHVLEARRKREAAGENRADSKKAADTGQATPKAR